MTLRRHAPGSFKPLATLAFLPLQSLLIAGLMALQPSLVRAAPPMPVTFATPSGADAGASLLQRDTLLAAPRLDIGLRPNLPAGWDYGTVLVRPIAGKQLRAALPLKQVLAFDKAAAPSAASKRADAGTTAAAEAPALRLVSASYGIADAAIDTEMPPATGVAEPEETSIVEVSAAPSTAPISQTRQIGMFVLLLTTLSAVTLLLWRHYRRDDASPRRIGRRI